MTLLRKFLLVALVTPIVSTAIAQDYERSRKTVNQFLDKMNRSVNELDLKSSPNKKLVKVTGPDFFITLDANQNILSWSDLNASSTTKKREEDRDQVIDNNQAIETARNWAASLGVDLYDDVQSSDKKSIGGNQLYTVTFKEKPFGYDALVGNYVTVDIHKGTGKVISMTRMIGFSYDKPDIKKSEADAVGIFMAKVRSAYNKVPENVKVVGLAFGTKENSASPMVNADCPNYFAEKRSRLVYRLEGELESGDGKALVFARVDAQNGDVLGGGIGKGEVREPIEPQDTRSARPENSLENSGLQSNNLLLNGSAAVILVFGCWLGYVLIFRGK